MKLSKIFQIVILWAMTLGWLTGHAALASNGEKPPLLLSLGAVDTENNSQTIFGKVLLEQTMSSLQGQITQNVGVSDNCRNNGRCWAWSFQPEIDLQTGGDDAFSSLVFKYTGYLSNNKWTEVAGLTTPNWNEFTHLIPIAVSAETDQNVDTLNAIAEAGWVPFKIGDSGYNGALGVNPFFGIYVQAGYKFELDSSGAAETTGGQVDNSEEEADDGIARLKMRLKYDVKMPVGGPDIVLKLEANGWYDAWNGEFYDQESATIRWTVGDKKYLDFNYSNGSGAPNFNTGQQFGANLTVQF